MKIQESFLQQVKGLDALEIIGQFVIMKRKSSNHVGLCPFHDEKGPSFTYFPAKGNYKCFGCDASGSNAIDFLMELESLTFHDAVYRAAYLGGISFDADYNSTPAPRPKQAAKALPVDYVPFDAIKTNLSATKANHLYEFFKNRFGGERTTASFLKYRVGSCLKHGNGTTMFTQFDLTGNCRHVKAILYNPSIGKRIREFDPVYIGKAIVSKHASKPYTEINLVQCFFGLHLINGNNKPIAICEAEKTAMICDLYYPQYVWIATGGKNGCRWQNKEALAPLTGRDVILFPDHDALALWSGYVEEIKTATGASVTTIDILNGKTAPEGKEKYDIADLLIDGGKCPPIVLEDWQIHSLPCSVIYEHGIIQTIKTKEGGFVDVAFDTKGELSKAFDGFSQGYFMGNHAAMRIANLPP